MKRSSLISRADLLQSLQSLDDDARAAAAELLGFTYQPRKKAMGLPKFVSGAETQTEDVLAAEPAAAMVSRSAVPTPFWRLDKYTPRQSQATPDTPPTTMPVWRNKPQQAPKFYWLETWRNLAPRLLQMLYGAAPGLDYDLDYAVEILARGENLNLLPRVERPRPLSRIQVVFDRSSHLIPYWFDQDLVASALRHQFGAENVDYAFVTETADDPSPEKPEQQGAYQLPPPGSAVLALSDLGSLSPLPVRVKSWLRFGRRVRAAGCRAIALVPGPSGLVDRALHRNWTLVQWEQGHGEPLLDRGERQRKARRLLALLAHAFRIEPGLLRAVRIALGSAGGDAGIEAEVWAQLEKQHVTAGTLDPKKVKEELLPDFHREDEDIKRAVLACQREWRHGVADEIWFDEVINLPTEAQALLPHPEDAEDAPRYFAWLAERIKTKDKMGAEAASWLGGPVEQRGTANAWDKEEYGRAVYEAKKDDPDFVLPGSVDPAAIQAAQALSGIVQFRLGQHGMEVLTPPADQRAAPQLGALLSENGILTHATIADPRPDPVLFWTEGKAPSWASGWGEDEFGRYAEFTVGKVVQRLRWVAPGRFVMGSSETEAGRWDEREGPQHEVVLSTGFWMMDTPVRQCLWRAVMGKNPSHFKSPERPVENVDYEMVGQFLARLNERLPGLNLSLPSEAQWEYACRAGSTAATYAGDLEILGERDAPVLDRIAWYGGNSGVGFELAEGEDSSDWDEKQYPDSPSGTHPVGQKAPNDLGLYDMLGNVWEWCADHWHGNYEGAPTDGSAWMTEDAAAVRVGRGGSWDGHAWIVRAACRGVIHPSSRLGLVGFRCVRVQASDSEEAAPVDRGAAQQAERRAAARSMGDAVAAIQLPRDTAATINLPAVGRLRVISDRAELEFAAIGRPSWATHMGCDSHGLFADFAIGNIAQRLRWIPPGRFMMGSPEGEAGRWDTREGPRHEVTLSEGFWMMDTPTRQDLWQAVMGDNPSQFKSADRPVESIDFKKIEQFLNRINEQAPGLDLSLPSEAQWEYACRAGSETATYAGDLQILGERNAPILDEIAWYGGNSGVGFELHNGYDSSKWKEVQYPNPRSGTHPVGQKHANDFGLHDMLGNVWEWCADHWHNNYDGTPTDGSAWMTEDAAADRVRRGGSWFDLAGDVRAASRDRIHPTYRDDFVGFRCVRVQAQAKKKGGR